MKQAEFETQVRDRGGAANLDSWIAVAGQIVAEQGGDWNVLPDGGEWVDSTGQGVGVIQVNPKVRVAYRNYCEWEELTLPNGQTGIYVKAHAPNADRFL